MDELWTCHLGRVEYREAVAIQERLRARVQAGGLPDLLLLLEHPPVYTLGRRSEPGELPVGGDIDIVETDRGGKLTYHGPGQLVGYPIVSLRPYGDDVHEYVRRMERLIVASLSDCGVKAEVVEGLTGVWTPERRKIGSIGVHVSRGVTTHGFAINVNNDLQPFEWIVPCGIEACRMTSLSRELGAEQDLGAFATTVRDRFGEVYGRIPIEIASDELAERLGAGEAVAVA
jgi:lipoyl(octanoyl) transferase